MDVIAEFLSVREKNDTAKQRPSCPKGLPPDAMCMSCKLVGQEPVENTQNGLQQQTTDKARQDVSRPDQVFACTHRLAMLPNRLKKKCVGIL